MCVVYPLTSKDGDIPFIAVLKRNNNCRRGQVWDSKGGKVGYSVKLDSVLET